ncbi:helix-turn-helix domain-containing protein [Mucilaginibacter sp. McL0603]|uniref:helix-turn-helix domain-containing protein n=1 Tax=Mucilaginibacter sp. McL0603 TaxID=3415670 RepID=UPI003CF520A7
MNVELITKDDLELFKKELFEQMQQIMNKPQFGEQKWLKSYQVKNLLKISPGTLQNLRVNGTLQFTKIGGIMYYKYEDIVKVLEGQKGSSLESRHPLRK